MTEPVDQEIEAIKTVLTALSPLSEKARSSVLDYVVKRLNIKLIQAGMALIQGETDTPLEGDGPTLISSAQLHIEEFKKQKKPRSANEMAALVAYYLANIVKSEERKNNINQQDIETYFKIAKFPLPKQIRVTLQNAKSAGYFDLVGEGQYRLNAVGHNLVVHSMPRGGHTKGGKRKPKKKSPNKAPDQS